MRGFESHHLRQNQDAHLLVGSFGFCEYKRFEDIKHIKADGTEFWYARELAIVLDYTQWRNFQNVIKRGMIACENSGHDSSIDFVEVSKIVDAGATSKPILDYELSRYACYLIVQNGDPRKEVIALGQTYFAIQTYRQEVADHFNQLSEEFALFQNVGWMRVVFTYTARRS